MTSIVNKVPEMRKSSRSKVLAFPNAVGQYLRDGWPTEGIGLA